MGYSRHYASRCRQWTRGRTIPYLVTSLAALLLSPPFATTVAQHAQPPKEAREIEQLQEDARKLGDWDNQRALIDEATDNIFQQQGWNSESDQWARSLMRDVGRVSPWNPQERQKLFLDGLQVRYTLTADQRSNLDGDIQREAMMVAMKHFKDTLPVAMEIIKTRAGNQPFTPEQVQRWSKALKPMMDDSFTAVERVVGKLGKTMTEEQRAKLKGDMDAFQKRHQGMQKMVEKWQAGNWNPTDWGLQNDPLHAGAMAQFTAAQAEKDRRAGEAEARRAEERGFATNESTWEQYVRQFCDRYGFSDTQRTQADAILQKHKKEALDYLATRRERIEQQQRLSQSPENSPAKLEAGRELERLLAPVGAIFERMQAQLTSLLTSEQRAKFPPPAAAPAKRPDPAPPKPPAQPAPSSPPLPAQSTPPQPTAPAGAPVSPPTTAPASVAPVGSDH